jgi:hypothetical protein
VNPSTPLAKLVALEERRALVVLGALQVCVDHVPGGFQPPPRGGSRWLQRGEAVLKAAEVESAVELPQRELEYARFVEKVRRAEAQAEQEALEKISGSADWRAQAWYLERRHPGRWAKRQNVDVTSKDQPIRTVEVVLRRGDNGE